MHTAPVFWGDTSKDDIMQRILRNGMAYLSVTGGWFWEEVDVQETVMLLLHPVHKLLRHIDLVRLRENCVNK